MTAYARRHYGLNTNELRTPRVIVQHVAQSATARSVYNTFAVNRPDPELRELPGVCSHFLIDRSGTIYQLVALRLMCRHTVGLNHVAIGVEHVGFRDGEVLGNRRQMAASLALAGWLRCRYGIPLRSVIGHAESLSSPHHFERVRRLRRQTHADFMPPAMTEYRRRLRRLPCDR
jgi:N-acetylmuramoyl-L-alanine amidase